jgi:NAD(P)-dependent dehydrogenase (short-subunit alcohol dehydrogenase family)
MSVAGAGKKVAVVTGGGRGVGKTITRALTELGYLVHICARSAEQLTATARELPGVRPAVVDVTDHARTYAWIEAILAEHGTVDVLVNNAGVMAPVGPLHEVNVDEWEAAFRRNLFSMVRICQQVIPRMIEARSGCIINLAGGGSAYPRKNFTAYACSKAAVVRLSDSLADELRPYGIRVNALAPGLQESEIWRHAARVGEQPPRQEWDSPKDLARLVTHMVTTPALTGKFLHIRDEYAKIDDAIMASDLFTLRRINPPAT